MTSNSKYSLSLVAALSMVIVCMRGDTGDLKWTFQAGDAITSSPAVDSEGNLYFGSLDNQVYSITSEGSLRWTRATGDWVESSPALSPDESAIYVGSWDDRLYALDTESGAIEWSYQTESLVYSSPAVGDDGTIYFGCSDTFFYALNADGSLKWEIPIGSEIDSSPSIDSQGRLYLGTSGGEVVALDSNGNEIWMIELPDEALSEDDTKAVVSSPMLSGDGRLYVGSGNAYLYALDTSDGSILWKYRAEDVVDVSPVMGVDGRILFSSRDGYLYALNNDGSLAWKTMAGIDYYSSPVVDATGRIYLCSYLSSGGNKLTAFSSTGSTLWSFPTQGYIDASPTIMGDGTICFGSSEGTFYAIEGGAGLSSSSVWPKFGRGLKQKSSLLGYELPTAGWERVLNFSLRGSPRGGAEDIISGFVVAGVGQKSLLARFVGPELSNHGIASPLADPKMDIYEMLGGAGQLIATADDWYAEGDPDHVALVADSVGAFPLADGSKDAATVVSFGAGIYTIIASSADGSSGIGLLELYDADSEDTGASLVNFSMRGVVGTGEEVLILGFVIGGNLPRRFLVRSVGAGLESFNVEGFAPDTRLKLYRGSQLYASNDDWDTGGEKADLLEVFSQVGAFDLMEGSGDSSLIVWLEPGIYTAVVSSATGETGIALVELYQTEDLSGN